MFYTRSSYVGQTTKDGKRMHGRGIYTLADGSKYIGTFHDGTFHGHGIIFYTPANGGGQFRGTWNLGECLGGDYIFKDGLEFSNEEWEYTTDRDRRFWHEYLTFIKPAVKDGTQDGDAAGGVITPDYSTTDGIPPAFANGKPQSAEAVSDDFWTTAPLPRPEHEGVAPIVGSSEDMATLIAQTRVGGPVTQPRNPPRKMGGGQTNSSRTAQQQQPTAAAPHRTNSHHSGKGPSAAELEALAAPLQPAKQQQQMVIAEEEAVETLVEGGARRLSSESPNNNTIAMADATHANAEPRSPPAEPEEAEYDDQQREEYYDDGEGHDEQQEGYDEAQHEHEEEEGEPYAFEGEEDVPEEEYVDGDGHPGENYGEEGYNQ